jgi:hypothetical protein
MVQVRLRDGRSTGFARVVSPDWTLIDPTFRDPHRRDVADRLVQLAASDWTADVSFDLRDAETLSVLDRHRVSTVVPMRCVAGESARIVHRERLQHIYGVQMRLESTAAEVLSLLTEHGIETRVLKGLASAELDYQDRRRRQTGDVDLAVRPEHTAAAITTLCEHGFRDTAAKKPSPHLLKGSTLIAPNGIEIDVHDRLFQRSPYTDALFAHPGIALGELPGLALCHEQRLVHAAGHFILAPPGSRRMSGLLDVTRILRSHSVDFTAAREFACELGVERLVGAALRFEASLSGRGDADTRFRDWAQPDWLERLTRVTGRRRLVLDQFSRFREIPRGERLSYVPIWLTPDHRRRRLFLRSAQRHSQRVQNALRRSR